jgi:Bacterial capsule synthesis protein PGA_cap
VKRGPLVAVLTILALALALPISGGLLGTSPSSPSPTAGVAGETARPTGNRSPGASVDPASPAPPSHEPAEPATPPPPDGPPGPVAIVPVTHFRSPAESTSRDELRAVLAGRSERYQRLELIRAEADAILGALGVEVPAGSDRLVLARDTRSLFRDLARSRDRLAFVRADEVTPAVRALAWAGRSLFGVDRVGRLRDWPVTAVLPTRRGAYDPARAWTLVAGGDILLDRGVALAVRAKGIDFPFDGGRAAISSRYCCSSFGWELPRTERLGDRGAMRDLLRQADLAIANFENPAPDSYRFHASGTVFSADPRLIEGLRNAGIDWVSLANNHIRDAGATGILDTIENLDDWGIRHGGAGADLAAARKVRLLRAGATRVAVLAYDTIADGYAAGANVAGSAQLSPSVVRTDVRAARKAGADVVIVFPH